MNRREWLKCAIAAAAVLAVDPERLLWELGKKTIFIPSPTFDEFPKIELTNSADFLAPGAIEINRYQVEIFNLVKRQNPFVSKQLGRHFL